MVTVIINERDVDVQGAMDYIGALHDRLVKSFLLAKGRLPSWGEPIDSQVARYVHGLGNWVRANYQWSFESQKYFGTKGLEIMKHRRVELLPRLHTADKVVINIPTQVPRYRSFICHRREDGPQWRSVRQPTVPFHLSGKSNQHSHINCLFKCRFILLHAPIWI